MLARLLRNPPREEQRALQVTPWGDWGTSMTSAAGINANADNAFQLLAVYGCVTMIADTIATLPRDVYRTGPDGLKEEVTNPPRWLKQPSPNVEIIEFLTQTITSLLLDGNAYWAYGVDLNFLPNRLVVLNPVDVGVRDDGDGPVYTVKGLPYEGRLLHIKGLTRPGCIKGLSPIESARQSIGLGLASQEFAARFYSNGTTMSGVIQTPGELNSDQARMLRDNWSRDHSGASKAHLPGVLTNGATWQQISITPEQAQFLQSREFQAAEICSQMFLLDPSMLGISIGSRGNNLTYANLEQRGIHLVQFTLLRWIIRLEAAFTFLLPAPQELKFNVDALQRADLKTRYESYAIALNHKPFMKLNEVRELENEPPVDGGDTIDTTSPATPAPAPQVPVTVAPSSNGKKPVGANA